MYFVLFIVSQIVTLVNLLNFLQIFWFQRDMILKSGFTTYVKFTWYRIMVLIIWIQYHLN